MIASGHLWSDKICFSQVSIETTLEILAQLTFRETELCNTLKLAVEGKQTNQQTNKKTKTAEEL